LKLHNKRFSPVAVDNIISPKILLYVGISQNPTTHKFLQHILCRRTRYLSPECTEKLTASGPEGLRPQTPNRALPLDPFLRLPASSPQCEV